jgi:hypothetical protein
MGIKIMYIIWSIVGGHYTTSQKVMGSNPNEVTGFSTDLILPVALYGPGIDSASNRNKNQEFS